MDLDQHRALVEKGYARRVELAKEGAKSMEEKKAELEKMKKELDDLQPIKAGIEASKNEAEQKESAAKGEEDRQWNGELNLGTFVCTGLLVRVVLGVTLSVWLRLFWM
jgi:hypothetical protein